MVYSTVGVGDIPAEATYASVHFQFLQQLCKTVLLWPFNQIACILKKKGCIPLDIAANMIKLSYLLPPLNMEIEVIVKSK